MSNKIKDHLESPPKHIAIIMDGNGRWATKKKKPRTMGHKAGVKTLKDIIKACVEYEIKYLSVYAFSTENWRRPKTEIDFLMNLLDTMINNEINNLFKEDVKVNILGEHTNLSEKLIKNINKIQNKTKNCSRLTLNLMINYGSRHEIISAINKIISESTDLKTPITEDIFTQYLYTKSIPDPEILIRTSGEKRISNFMLWQIAYSEIYFEKKLWPDFTIKDYNKILNNFKKTKRNFGKI